MGWSHCGTDSNGREIGYSIEATCDFPGCSAQIHRGLAYACGGMHGIGEYDCDRYFCYEHLVHVVQPPNGRAISVCEECYAALVTDEDDNILPQEE